MPECVWRASLLIWHIVCSLWFTAQPGNVRQEQAPATEGKTEKKSRSVNGRIVSLCVPYIKSTLAVPWCSAGIRC